MTELSARDVIARAVVDQEAPEGVWNAYVASYPGNQKRADAIIDALHEAGYTITPRADGNDRLRELRVWIDAEQTEVLNTLAAWEAENAYGALHADHVQHGSLMGRDRMAGDIMGHIDAMLAAEPEPELRIDIYARGFNEGFASALEQCGMEQVIPVAPEPDPAPSVVTGPQLKAGLGAFLNVFLNGAKPDTIPQMWVTAVNAALEAAERIRTGGQG